MSAVEIVLWTQVVALNLGAVASILFLARYLRISDRTRPAAKFLVSLNAMFILVVWSTTWGRFVPNVMEIEIAKGVFMAGLAYVMTTQLWLLQFSRGRRGLHEHGDRRFDHEGRRSDP